MPCNSITTVSLHLENADLDILEKALRKLGYYPERYGIKQENLRWEMGGRYIKATGELVVGTEEEGAQVKREYSKELVRNKASRFGWRLKQVSENRFQIQKG